MYIANNVKSVILYGNALVPIKKLNCRLKHVPNTRIATDLLHEISHNYKISYVAFLQGVNLPHPLLKFQGST